jgi:N6-L-threonylcarbamoyladenine synthase
MLVAPPPALCTDNAAMIAWTGAERLALGLTDTLEAAPHARWPLEAVKGPPEPVAPPADATPPPAADAEAKTEPAAAPEAN